MTSSVPKTTSPLEKDNKKSEKDNKKTIPSLNDNSNPQQGTGGGGAGTRVSATNKQPPTGDNMKANQQQLRAPLKIPPTVKDARKLFVGGLPSDVTTEEFHSFFEQFGKVVDSVVMFDRMTSRSRGFGFITFEDPTVCTSLLGPDNIGRVEFRGKVVEIKSAEPKAAGETRHGSGISSPTMKASLSNMPPSAASFDVVMEQPPNPPSATPYCVPPAFYPSNFPNNSNTMVAPLPAGTYYPMGAPMTPYEQNSAYYFPTPYAYQPNTMPNGAYGFVPVFYPDAAYNYYPAYPESVMQEVTPSISGQPDDQ